jgi:hypothetical protein
VRWDQSAGQFLQRRAMLKGHRARKLMKINTAFVGTNIAERFRAMTEGMTI